MRGTKVQNTFTHNHTITINTAQQKHGTMLLFSTLKFPQCTKADHAERLHGAARGCTAAHVRAFLTRNSSF